MEWTDVFGWYRDERDIPQVVERFKAAGISPGTADRLLRAGLTGGLAAEGWAEVGPLGIALVAAEVDRAADVARRRAAALRSAAIARMAETVTIVEIARQLGQGRQAVSKAAHGSRTLVEWARDVGADAARLIEDGVAR
jgi:hypothetical protein